MPLDDAVDNAAASTIRAFIVESFLFGQDDGFAMSDPLIETGIIDSTGVVELVAYVEETFGIEIAEEEMVAENLDSVDRIAALVARKQAGRV